MFGRETFILRMDDDAMAPCVLKGDHVYVDPDEPACDGCMVAVWDGETGATTVRVLVERDGQRVLRTPAGSRPERLVDRGNETDIRGVVVFVGRRV